MDRKVLQIIRTNPYIYSFFMVDSSHYKYLVNDPSYIKEIDRLAKERYKLRFSDKMDRLSNNLEILKTFLEII